MKVSIQATNINLTNESRNYVQAKMDALDKFAKNNLGAKVEIGIVSHHHQKGKIYKAEVNLRLPGKTIYIEKKAKNLLKAIDKVKDHLRIMLVGQKEKLIDKRKRGASLREKNY